LPLCVVVITVMPVANCPQIALKSCCSINAKNANIFL
jgi:hypothetical protein